MAKIRILNKKDIKKVINLKDIIDATEKAYVQKATGDAEVWPMVFHEFDPGHADLDIKSGNLNQAGIYGLKVVSFFDSNENKNLPVLTGTSMIFDIKTGQPKAVLNAGPITDYRTGAAGAIGAKYLARENSENLLMVGCGALAPYLIAATLLTMPKIEKITLVNPRNPANAEERLETIRERVNELLYESGVAAFFDMKAESDTEKAVAEADVILTATPSYEPMIKKEWVKPGTHFSCVGSDMSGKQEIDENIMAGALVFGDDLQQCKNVGECEKAFKAGILTELRAEIGDVISGKIAGRLSDEDITVFDSTGIALQDLVSAACILTEAEKLGLGTTADL